MHDRRIAALGLGICAVALVMTGCSSSGANKAAAESDGSATTSTTSNETTPHTHAGVKVLTGTATGTSPCEIASPTPASPGQVGAGSAGSDSVNGQSAVIAGEHGERGMVRQFSLTRSQRTELETQMTQARAVVAEYPTVKDAEAAGYRKSTPYVPCIGAHYTNIGLTMGFNPKAPSELLYDGTSADSKLVGLSYLVFNPGGKAPSGFAGKNDHWHQHNANGGLCLQGGVVVGGEETTRKECAARGGRKTLLTDVWMMHAWVVPGFECSWGVFSGECPELGGRIGGTAWDTPQTGQNP
jgi:hypothetical protein